MSLCALCCSVADLASAWTPLIEIDMTARSGIMINWYRAQVTGDIPSPLYKHTSTLVGTKVYLFGTIDVQAAQQLLVLPADAQRLVGLAKDREPVPKEDVSSELDKIYIFDTETLVWAKKRASGSIPSPRLAHSSTAIYMFGGGIGAVFYNDLYILDTKTLAWSKATVTGTLPNARRAHSATLIGTKLYIFGGGETGGKPVNDTYVLDVEKFTWARFDTKENIPQPRGFHSANAIGSKIVVFGGSDTKEVYSDLCVLDTERRVWTRAKAIHPVHRFAHSATLVGHWLILFGGHDGAEYVDSMHVLNLDTLEWSRKSVAGMGPVARGYHTTLFHDSRLWILGGCDAKRSFNDLYLFDFAAYGYLVVSRRAPRI